MTAGSNDPVGSDKMICLTCHRAHASGWQNALRWNPESEFVTYAGLYPGTDNPSSNYARGHSAAEAQAAHYDRPVTGFGTYQRVLCNKRHIKD
jgi:predicted CXXCH cytochrome family protein